MDSLTSAVSKQQCLLRLHKTSQPVDEDNHRRNSEEMLKGLWIKSAYYFV